jgi:MarR family 2-MHQ and catechol resistance regulon transcriptional repressor
MATGYGKQADLALDLWVKLARAYETMSQVAAEDIRRYGLTQPQFGVIEALGHLGKLTLGELSRKMLSSCGNITVVIDNLEEDGLVERLECPTDRRVTYVDLTAKGRRLFKGSFTQHARRIAEAASVLSPEEQRELSRLLRKMGLSLVAMKKKIG